MSLTLLPNVKQADANKYEDPAVTLAMVMTKAINYVRGILLVGAQIAGAIFASFIVSVLFPTDFNVRTTLADNTSIVRGLFIEAILTAELVFTVFMLAKEKHKATYMAPIGIGIALFVAELVGVFFTGGSLNPARSLGPCVIVGEFDKEHWIYCEFNPVRFLSPKCLILFPRGRSRYWRCGSCGILPLHQSPRVRGGKSRPRYDSGGGRGCKIPIEGRRR